MSNNPNQNEQPEDEDQDGQQTFDRWGGGVPMQVPPEMEFHDPAEAFDEPLAEIDNELQRYGITPEVVGKAPDEVDASYLSNIYRYQFFCEYLYEAGNSREDGNTPVAPIQWRTSIYTIGHPSQALMDYLADTANGRQKTLFDTGAYEDYFTNWAPFEGGYNENVEGPERVGPDEVQAALCVPFFEVEIYDEDRDLRGEARGYLDPFERIEYETPPPPERERWRIGPYQSARDSYEFRPEGNARDRLRGLEKIVSLDGHYIGTTYPSRGTVELINEYDNADQTHTHRTTGLLRHSRQYFIDNDIFHPNAIKGGGYVWKVDETEDTISLRSTKPERDWDYTTPEEIDERATGEAVLELALDPEYPTRFEVRADNSIYGALGRYAPVVERFIETETEFEVYDPASDTYIMR